VDFLSIDFVKDSTKKLFFLASFFLWFAAFNKVRFSAENWSVCLFIIAWTNISKPQNKNWKLLLNGTFLGISFLIKFQLGFFIAGLMAWQLFIQKEKLSKLIVIFIGLLFAIAIGVAVDFWLYGKWVLSCWNYLQQLLFAKYTGSFENEPWWYFFQETFNKGVPPISILLIVALLYFYISEYKSVITWITFPFLFIHFFIGHKEIRFLFPVIPFLPYIILKANQTAQERLQWYANFVATKWATFIWKITIALNTIFLVIVCF
jgi:phosphatidylinositol glycan class B